MDHAWALLGKRYHLFVRPAGIDLAAKNAETAKNFGKADEKRPGTAAAGQKRKRFPPVGNPQIRPDGKSASAAPSAPSFIISALFAFFAVE